MTVLLIAVSHLKTPGKIRRASAETTYARIIATFGSLGSDTRAIWGSTQPCLEKKRREAPTLLPQAEAESEGTQPQI